MTDIQKQPPFPEGTRPETGPMQFGDDWPGVFIRGDNALFFANVLNGCMKHINTENGAPILAVKVLDDLVKTLRSCSVGDTGWPP